MTENHKTAQLINLWLLHDHPQLGPSLTEFFEVLGEDSLRVKFCNDILTCFNKLNQIITEADVVIIHKGLGEHHPHLARRLRRPFNTYEGFLRKIHEKAPHIRIGVLSGEFPDGSKEVIEYGADFYTGGSEIHSPEDLKKLLQMVLRGPVSPKEMNNRGIMVETLEGKLYKPGISPSKETYL